MSVGRLSESSSTFAYIYICLWEHFHKTDLSITNKYNFHTTTQPLSALTSVCGNAFKNSPTFAHIYVCLWEHFQKTRWTIAQLFVKIL